MSIGSFEAGWPLHSESIYNVIWLQINYLKGWSCVWNLYNWLASGLCTCINAVILNDFLVNLLHDALLRLVHFLTFGQIIFMFHSFRECRIQWHDPFIWKLGCPFTSSQVYRQGNIVSSSSIVTEGTVQDVLHQELNICSHVICNMHM